MGKMTADQIILALDVDTLDEALGWARRLKGRVGTCKVGLQLYLRDGPAVLRGLAALEMPVFLDLKFHDIPNTVAQAVAAAGVWQPRFLTLHASGGREMMEAARAKASPKTALLGVTVLTSLSEDAVRELGWEGDPRKPSRGFPPLLRLPVFREWSAVLLRQKRNAHAGA